MIPANQRFTVVIRIPSAKPRNCTVMDGVMTDDYFRPVREDQGFRSLAAVCVDTPSATKEAHRLALAEPDACFLVFVPEGPAVRSKSVVETRYLDWPGPETEPAPPEVPLS